MISLKNIKAVIFDMDGTMVNNSQFHKKAWMDFCKKYDFPITEKEYWEKISGKRNDAVLELIFGQIDSEKMSQYEEEKEQLYRDAYSLEMAEVAGLSDLITKLKEKGIKVAIATTSYGKNREFVLKSLNLTDQFDVIVGSEHVSQGKPNPEIYLKTASLLNIDPKGCLAFEDSPPGIQAAKGAGMQVVGILTAHSAEELKGVDLLIENFNQFKYI